MATASDQPLRRNARIGQVSGIFEDSGGIPEANFLRTTALRTAFFTAALRTAFFTPALRTAFFTAALRTAFFAAPFLAGFLAVDFFAVFLLAAFGIYRVLSIACDEHGFSRNADAGRKVHSIRFHTRLAHARDEREAPAPSNYRAHSDA
jgi:hypothetical protein